MVSKLRGRGTGWRVGMATAGLLWAGSLGAGAQVKVAAAFAPREELKEKTAPDPAHLSDIARVKVEADSGSGIARVVFEVDDQFRAEVKKPPFQFDWDTLDENDGQHTLAITAYNTNGQTGVKRVKTTVENKLNLGIGYYANQGLAAYRRGDARELDKAARKASKINRADPQADRIMALNVAVKGDVNRAFQMLDDNNINVPKEDPITYEVRGFLLLARAANAPNPAAMLDDLTKGMDLTRSVLPLARDRARAEHPETSSDWTVHLARGDDLFLINDFDAAQAAYEKALALAPDADAKRRVRLHSGAALLRGGRLQEAEDTARRLTRDHADDSVSMALLGAVRFRQRDYQGARQAVANGVSERNLAALTVAAVADLALGMRASAYREARDAVNLADMAETQYVAQGALADAGDQTGARKSFQIAFLRAPLFLPTLVARAYELMAYDKAEDRFIQGMNIVQVVLKADPLNAPAEAARVMGLIQQKHWNAATTALAKLSIADPNAPDLYVLKAAILAANPAKNPESKAALLAAQRLDPLNYKDVFAPFMSDFALRLTRLRRTIPLSPALCDRADRPIAEGEKTAAAN